MSEGSVCDRCGQTHPGRPYATFRIGQGIPRSRRGEPQEMREGTELWSEEPDLCRACVNDLRAWYREGGGDPSDVSGDWGRGENDD